MKISSENQAHLKGFDVTEVPSSLITQKDEIFQHFPGSFRVDIPEQEFLDWVELADYEHAGTNWWQQFSKIYLRKMLEHFCSIELVDLRAGGTYMDAAASASPFYKVIRTTHGAAMCYRQDLNYNDGLRDDTIGSDASAIPLPDASLDGIVSHNSWEHFEGDSAIDFVKEAGRLLKTGGRLCIVPMVFRERTEIWTSPSCWATKYRNAPQLPEFYRSATIVINEEIVQRQILWWNPEDLARVLEAEITTLKFRIVQVVCGNKMMYALIGERL